MKISDEMVEAAARASFQAHHDRHMISSDWDTVRMGSLHDDRRKMARAALEAALPLIAKATIERCAEVAYNVPQYASVASFDDLDERGKMRPGSPYDRGRYDAARDILALGEDE